MEKLSVVSALRMSDNDIFSYLVRLLRKKAKGKDRSCVTDGENYIYYHHEESKMMLNAHIDTMCGGGFKSLSLSKEESRLFNNNGVLGADDRSGVFIICFLLGLDTLPPFDVLFTNYEESGGKGCKKFIADNKIKSTPKLVIGVDRRGFNQYVTYHNVGEEVHKYMKSFGWAKQTGTFSDIRILTEKYRFPSVNVSAGYISEHTANESLFLSAIQKIVDKLKEMIKKPFDKDIVVHKNVQLSYIDGDTGLSSMYGTPVKHWCMECGGFRDHYMGVCGECKDKTYQSYYERYYGGCEDV